MQKVKEKYVLPNENHGFLCGRALGGHMRAHGMCDDGGNTDADEDQASYWDGKIGGGSNKCMYTLRANPSKLKNCRACENCGKEYSSWKSFLEHGKCSSEDAESLVSPPRPEGEDGMAGRNSSYGGGDNGGGNSVGWIKRKRSIRVEVGNFISKSPPEEEEDLANCLMMLSKAAADPLVVISCQLEESCTAAGTREERRNPINFVGTITTRAPPLDEGKGGVAKGMFECKACKKEMIRAVEFDNNLIMVSRKKPKVHECSICHRIFSSGQALGGHKRCHWMTSNAPAAGTSTPARFQQLNYHIKQAPHQLDLNLPAPNDDIVGLQRDPTNQLTLQVSKEFYQQSWGGGVEAESKEEHRSCLHNQQEEDDIDDSNVNQKKRRNCHRETVEDDGDDEADSKVKVSKLSELKDINMHGSFSPWLQVGIGSSNNGVVADL
ncbi:hypothetical protein Nepgr_023501 [Nepenthes gracilis]|uniref:C2H2-type domain-containing protein n=1 Tax=Nepenthes gracilis TaxID=150966 RepID=A0AAD3XZ40_NEPGR|nr:hypothetical protein Nepgr_023501 [Nepenthes gracilis]